MRHVAFADFKSDDGKFDSAGYAKANAEARRLDVEDGLYCYQCGAFNIYSKGHRVLCYSCTTLGAEDGATSHERLIRCPKCAKAQAASEYEDGGIYDDGEHALTCPDCGHEFEISTHVSYRFTSPARLSK